MPATRRAPKRGRPDALVAAGADTAGGGASDVSEAQGSDGGPPVRRTRRTTAPLPKPSPLGAAADASDADRLAEAATRSTGDAGPKPAAPAPAQLPYTLPPGVAAVYLSVRWHGSDGGARVHALRLKPVPSVDALGGLSSRLLARAFADGAPSAGGRGGAASQGSGGGGGGRRSSGGTPLPTRPAYLSSPSYYRFTPVDEFMSLPGDVARTEFRLVVVDEDGWERTVLRRDMGDHSPGGAAVVGGAEQEADGSAATPPPPGAAPPAADAAASAAAAASAPAAGPTEEEKRKLLVTVVEFESAALIGGGQFGVRLSLVAYPVVSVSRAFLDSVAGRLRAGDPTLVGLL